MAEGNPGDQSLTGGPLVRFEAVSKRFGNFVAVERLSLDIFQGEFFALLGPSGCGKTTLLRMLAGFEQPSEGRILLGGEDISAVPPHLRPVNMMFQSYALFPHMSVERNIAFGLKQDGMRRSERAERVREMLALVKLEGLGARKPHQLSGGQRQRVALARAIAKRPKVLLLDEPLSALDRKLREDTRFELMAIQEKLGLTFVIVTHDQEEAMTVADRIGVMNAGRLAQVDTPSGIYERPNSVWIADFMGGINLIEGKVASSFLGHILIESNAGERMLVTHPSDALVGAVVSVAVRPEKLQIATTAATRINDENSFTGPVAEVGYLGGLTSHKVKLDNGLDVRVTVVNGGQTSGRPIASGDRVWLSFSPESAVVLTK